MFHLPCFKALLSNIVSQTKAFFPERMLTALTCEAEESSPDCYFHYCQCDPANH